MVHHDLIDQSKVNGTVYVKIVHPTVVVVIVPYRVNGILHLLYIVLHIFECGGVLC